MKARIILNEIKQDKESGLGAIGIGKESMFKGYKEIKKIAPNFEERCYPIENNPMTEPIEFIIMKISRIFNCKVSDLLITRSFGKESISAARFIEDVILDKNNLSNEDVELLTGRILVAENSYDYYSLKLSKYWQVAKIMVNSLSAKTYYIIRYK
jgi:hypothetical protein